MSGTYRDPPTRCASCGVERQPGLMILADEGPLCSACEAGEEGEQRLEAERRKGGTVGGVIAGLVISCALGYAPYLVGFR